MAYLHLILFIHHFFSFTIPMACVLWHLQSTFHVHGNP
uniref:Uncharacterized protein n=1 Tax=Arundo donax TaxID=35708 RepID=A0A0A8ZIX5_ARUDO